MLLLGLRPRLLEELQQAVDTSMNVLDCPGGSPPKIEVLVRSTYDVIVLDLNTYHDDGLTLLERWRQAGLKTCIMVLTRVGNRTDKLTSLEQGADDCLASPPELPELLARLRALARRNRLERTRVLRIGDLEIDTGTHTVRRGGYCIPLTPREYQLLEFLASRRGQVVSRTTITRTLYNEPPELMSNVVAVYIRYLRNKIDKGFDRPLIVTCWRRGYMLRTDPDASEKTCLEANGRA
jgi:DNA-binding response OmpR family regulator